jgi:hypothetical protein
MTRNRVDQLFRGLTLRARGLLANAAPDRVILSRRYQKAFGRPLDLRHPESFNEKLYWLRLYYRTPLVTTLTDKYPADHLRAPAGGPGGGQPGRVRLPLLRR